MSKALHLAIAAAAALSCSAVLADTMDMTVNAKVNGTCRMVTAPTVDFGTLNQVTAADITLGAVQVQYKCTKGLSPTAFTIGGAAAPSYSGTVSNGTDTIPYTLTWSAAQVTAGLGMATGKEISVDVVGKMTGTDYQDAPAGTYTAAVTIEITP
jgi:hypothetical protein